MFFKKSLASLHSENSGKISDKWQKYIEVYERILAPLRTSSINMLEIGVQNGGSLDVWSKYFKSAKLVLGCDIDPLCGGLVYTDNRVKVLVGDATKPQTMRQIQGYASSFDLIIDDGSHQSKDVIDAFLLYFPMLKPGGTFIVEDTHTLYWAEFGGGLYRKDCAKEFFKALTDIINFEHWRSEGDINNFLESTFSVKASEFIEDGWVESVEFCNSMIIIKKSVFPSHSKLGRRLISGAVADVHQGPIHLRENAGRTKA
jgi:cephalosporin hydroxylase